MRPIKTGCNLINCVIIFMKRGGENCSNDSDVITKTALENKTLFALFSNNIPDTNYKLHFYPLKFFPLALKKLEELGKSSDINLIIDAGYKRFYVKDEKQKMDFIKQGKIDLLTEYLRRYIPHFSYEKFITSLRRGIVLLDSKNNKKEDFFAYHIRYWNQALDTENTECIIQLLKIIDGEKSLKEIFTLILDDDSQSDDDTPITQEYDSDEERETKKNYSISCLINALFLCHTKEFFYDILKFIRNEIGDEILINYINRTSQAIYKSDSYGLIDYALRFSKIDVLDFLYNNIPEDKKPSFIMLASSANIAKEAAAMQWVCSKFPDQKYLPTQVLRRTDKASQILQFEKLVPTSLYKELNNLLLALNNYVEKSNLNKKVLDNTNFSWFNIAPIRFAFREVCYFMTFSQTLDCIDISKFPKYIGLDIILNEFFYIKLREQAEPLVLSAFKNNKQNILDVIKELLIPYKEDIEKDFKNNIPNHGSFNYYLTFISLLSFNNTEIINYYLECLSSHTLSRLDILTTFAQSFIEKNETCSHEITLLYDIFYLLPHNSEVRQNILKFLYDSYDKSENFDDPQQRHIFYELMTYCSIPETSAHYESQHSLFNQLEGVYLVKLRLANLTRVDIPLLKLAAQCVVPLVRICKNSTEPFFSMLDNEVMYNIIYWDAAKFNNNISIRHIQYAYNALRYSINHLLTEKAYSSEYAKENFGWVHFLDNISVQLTKSKS